MNDVQLLKEAAKKFRNQRSGNIHQNFHKPKKPTPEVPKKKLFTAKKLGLIAAGAAGVGATGALIHKVRQNRIAQQG